MMVPRHRRHLLEMKMELIECGERNKDDEVMNIVRWSTKWTMVAMRNEMIKRTDGFEDKINLDV